jgi:hypothetical protein
VSRYEENWVAALVGLRDAVERKEEGRRERA